MADKFEFKRQKDLVDSLQKSKYRTRPSLIQYKQVIIELSETLSALSLENEQLKSQKQKIVQTSKQLQKRLSLQLSNSNSLMQKQKSWQEQKIQLNKVIKSQEQQQSRKDIKIKSLQQQVDELQQKGRIQIEKNSTLQSLNEVNIEKIRILEESMQKLAQQSLNIRLQAENVRKYNKDQLLELRIFNDEIKKKFQVLEVNLEPKDSAIEPENRKVFDQKLNELKQKRCFSTQKKQRRIAGCLSVTTNNLKGTSRIKPETLFGTQNEYTSKIQAPWLNPELGDELMSLKKQIAHQYTLINIKNQAYNKQRVSKALNQLRRKMGRVVEVAEQSEQESFF